MDKASAAEWILRRVVNSDRASELVGDQLEFHPTAGPLRFWLVIVWLFFAFSWRTLAGLAAAVVVGYCSWLPFVIILQRRVMPEHLLTQSSILVAIHCLNVSMLFWAVAGFSLVRFGIRSELSRVSFTGALLGTTAACFLWLPYAPSISLAGASAWLFFYLSSSQRRRALVVLSVASMLGWLTTASSWFIFRHLLRLHEGSFTLIIEVLLLALVPVVEGAASLLLAERFLDRERYELVG